MRKALAWAAAGTTIAAGLLSVAATANAATVSHAFKAPTALSIRESAVRGHAKDSIAGTLSEGRKGLGGEVVTLDIVNGKRVTPGGVARTGRNGAVSFTVAPKKTTSYVLVFGGSKTLAASHSGIVTIRVK